MYNHIRLRVAGWAALIAAAAIGVPSTSSLCKHCHQGTASLQECPCSQQACRSCGSCDDGACAAPDCCGKQICCEVTASATCCEDSPSCSNSSVSCPLVASAMSGCASFLRESDHELASQREQLARDLAGYLATRNHAPEHVCQLLHTALDSVADDAHRAAMNSQFSANFVVPVPAPPAPCTENAELDQMRRTLAEQQQRLDRLQENMFALARHVGNQEAPARECGIPIPGTDRVFTRVRVPMPCPAASATTSETEMLKQRIAQLEAQLHAVRGTPLASGVSGHVGDHPHTARVHVAVPFQMNGVSSPVPAEPVTAPVRQPGNSGMPIPLTPAEPSAAMPAQPVLQPTAWHSTTVPFLTRRNGVFTSAPAPLAPMEERTYYVGDLISPPYASGIMRVMQLIKMTVEPESWEHASIEVVSPAVSLRINQSAENHEKISNVLHLLRPQAINQ